MDSCDTVKYYGSTESLAEVIGKIGFFVQNTKSLCEKVTLRLVGGVVVTHYLTKATVLIQGRSEPVSLLKEKLQCLLQQ